MINRLIRELLQKIGEFVLDHIPDQVADYPEWDYPDYWKEKEKEITR